MRAWSSKTPMLGLALAATVAGVAACSRTHSETAGSPAPTDSMRQRTSEEPSPAPASPASTTPAADTAAAPSGASAPAGAPAPAAADSQWLKYDAATNTVTFELVAGPFDFNGFTNGGATLTVPARSNNVINFKQNDGTPHSAEFASGSGPVPNSGGNPAIPRAYTNKVVEGLPQEATDVIKFTAPDNGTYRIICGVPGHALSGMWLWYKVDPAAKTPSFGPTPK